MDISYERKGDKSYMVLKGAEGAGGYEWQMLRSNEIKELLPFFTMEKNGEVVYYYDISGKEALSEYIKREGLTPEVLKKTVFYLGTALEKLGGYLITEEHIYMTPDTIFVERHKNTFIMSLCYYPGEEHAFTEQINELFGYIIGEAPHADKPFTALCYSIYEETVKDHFSFKTIREMVAEYGEQEPEVEEDVLPVYKEDEPVYVEKVYPHAETLPEPEEEDEFDSLIDKLIRSVKNRKSEETGGRQRRKAESAGEAGGLDRYKAEDSGKVRRKARKADKSPGVKQRADKKSEKKKKRIYEPEDDLIYEPEEILPEQTVLLSDIAAPGGKFVYEGGGNEEDIYIEKRETAIGSQREGNDIVLKSPGVSRHHARIIKEGGNFYVEDLNSTNGTYLNGKPLSYREKAPLKNRDLVSFGDAAFRMV